MFLRGMKKVISGREIDFLARRNRFSRAEIEFSARKKTLFVKR
jgi:hypothetical protein